MAVNPIRDGFHSVTPCLFAEGAERLIDFAVSAFEAQVVSRKDRPDGAVMHAELRIGDSMGDGRRVERGIRPDAIFDLSLCDGLRFGLSTCVGQWRCFCIQHHGPSIW